MPDDSNPPETQPFPNYPNRNNREYIAAEWAASGSWTGSPKLSGGVELTKGGIIPAPRGLNRPDQRYELPAATMQSNRAARAVTEYTSTFFLITELDRFECQTASGKSVDCVPLADQVFVGGDGELHMCQCEDDWRLRQSGYTFTTVCKHVIMLRQWLLDTIVDDRFYSLEYVAERTPYALRTLEAMCKSGFLIAEMVGRQWGISAVIIEDVIAALLARIVPLPHIGDIP